MKCHSDVFVNSVWGLTLHILTRNKEPKKKTYYEYVTASGSGWISSSTFKELLSSNSALRPINIKKFNRQLQKKQNKSFHQSSSTQFTTATKMSAIFVGVEFLFFFLLSFMMVAYIFDRSIFHPRSTFVMFVLNFFQAKIWDNLNFSVWSLLLFILDPIYWSYSSTPST